MPVRYREILQTDEAWTFCALYYKPKNSEYYKRNTGEPAGKNELGDSSELSTSELW